MTICFTCKNPILEHESIMTYKDIKDKKIIILGHQHYNCLEQKAILYHYNEKSTLLEHKLK